MARRGTDDTVIVMSVKRTLLSTVVMDAVGLLLLLSAGCASVTPDKPVSQPPAAAAQPASSPTPPTPEPKAAPPVVRTAAPTARTSRPAASPVAAPAARAAPVTLDLNALEERLKNTKAIGLFTKISLKNKVDDLLDQVRVYHGGKTTLTVTELRRSYDLLMMKVLSLLQDDDQNLATTIVASREAIWALLADPKKFAALQS